MSPKNKDKKCHEREAEGKIIQTRLWGWKHKAQETIPLCFLLVFLTGRDGQITTIGFVLTKTEELRKAKPSLVSKILLSLKCSENKRKYFFISLPVVLKSIQGQVDINSPK